MGESLLWIREIPATEIASMLRGCGLGMPADGAADFSAKSVEPAGLREIELATEADASLVAQSGGAAEANARILSIVNAVNGFYESDLGLSNRIVVQRAWSGRDPYKSKNSEKLLSEFRDRFSRDVTTPYDDAQLFSGRNFHGKSLGHSWGDSACGSSAAVGRVDHSRRPLALRAPVRRGGLRPVAGRLDHADRDRQQR